MRSSAKRRAAASRRRGGRRSRAFWREAVASEKVWKRVSRPVLVTVRRMPTLQAARGCRRRGGSCSRATSARPRAGGGECTQAQPRSSRRKADGGQYPGSEVDGVRDIVPALEGLALLWTMADEDAHVVKPCSGVDDVVIVGQIAADNLGKGVETRLVPVLFDRLCVLPQVDRESVAPGLGGGGHLS